jgi:hypothetical protein
MLAVAVLVAGLFGGSKHDMVPASLGCPPVPTAPIAPTAVRCPALDVSGRIDATGAAIDPAFETSAPVAELVRPAESGPVLAGYAADGRQLFAVHVAASGPFHLYVPLATAAQDVLARLTLTDDRISAERTASKPVAEAEAEIISTSDERVIVAWNATAFPAIRVANGPEESPAAFGSGTSTYEQMTVDTRARRVYVTFSNGVRSVTRGFTIFGR